MHAKYRSRVGQLHLTDGQHLHFFCFLPRMMHQFVTVFPFDTHRLFGSHRAFNFQFQPTFCISTPTVNYLSLRRNQHKMGNSSDAITGIQSVGFLQIVPVIPSHGMRFRSLFPSFPVLNAQTDHLQAVLVPLADFFQLRLRHHARATSPAPEIQQDVFSAKLCQMVNLAFQIIHIRIDSFLARLDHGRRIQSQIHALPF